MSRKLETSKGTFKNKAEFARHFRFEYSRISKIIREGRVEELFSGLFMGYDPTSLLPRDRRIACAIIAKRVKAYSNIVTYIQEQIKTSNELSIESVLLTSEHDYVYAQGDNIGKITLACGNKDHPNWTVRASNLLERKSWCGHCRKSVKKTNDQIQQELAQRGLRIISPYLNANSPITIECQNGHISTLTLSKIVNGNVGCPICSAPREEAIVRHYLEHLMGVKFDQVRKRPSWLHKITGSRLELDGFCSTRNIAFEYQGEHHYKQVGYNHSTLAVVQARDEKKKIACQIAGVQLLVIPTLHKNWKEADAGEHVWNFLKFSGLPPVTTLDNVPRFIKVEPEKLAVLREAVTKRGGVLLETSYKGYRRPHLVRCGCGNEWGASPVSIFQGSWCPKCGRLKVLAGAASYKKQKYNNDRPRNLERLRQAIEKFGGTLLETEYKGYKTPHLMRCNQCGYQWSATPNSIYQGSFCKKCGQKKLVEAARASTKKRSEEKTMRVSEANVLIADGTSIIDVATKLKKTPHTVRRYLRMSE